MSLIFPRSPITFSSQCAPAAPLTDEELLRHLLDTRTETLFVTVKTDPEPENIKTMSAKIDMARIFDLENYVKERRLHLLSAGYSTFPKGGPDLQGAGKTPMTDGKGGSYDKDADFSEALKLLRKAIKAGKVPRRPDGQPMSDHELLSYPLEQIKKILDETPDGPEMADPSKDPAPIRLKTMSASLTPRRSLAEIFDEENEKRYGK